MNLLTFLENKNRTQKSLQMLSESVKNTDFDKAVKLITSLLKKKVDGLYYGGHYTILQKGKALESYLFVKDGEKPIAFTLNVAFSDKSADVYSIDFYNGYGIIGMKKAKTALTIYTMGSSVAYFIPIIVNVCNSGNFSLNQTTAQDLANQVFKENREFFIGAVTYKVFENMNMEIVDNAFKIATEALYDDDEANDYRRTKKKERDDAFNKKLKGEMSQQQYDKIAKEYEQIMKAIQGGATTIGELNMAINKNVEVSRVEDQTVKDAEKMLDEEEHASPEEQYKEIEITIKGMINKGKPRGILISSGPGLGKTTRVLRILKEYGYEDGGKLHKVEGKITAPMLYKTLYEHRGKGEIIFFDDATVLGPEASQDMTEIFKAALNSTPQRKVSYNTSSNNSLKGNTKRDTSNDVPTSFIYEGYIIFCTNYAPEKIDSAVRTRTFMHYLNFSTKQLLDFIKKIMTGLSPEEYSTKVKMKAYEYLENTVANSDSMPLNLRTFMTCLEVFNMQEADEDLTDKMVQHMVKQQLALQAL